MYICMYTCMSSDLNSSYVMYLHVRTSNVHVGKAVVPDIRQRTYLLTYIYMYIDMTWVVSSTSVHVRALWSHKEAVEVQGGLAEWYLHVKLDRVCNSSLPSSPLNLQNESSCDIDAGFRQRDSYVPYLTGLQNQECSDHISNWQYCWFFLISWGCFLIVYICPSSLAEPGPLLHSFLKMNQTGFWSGEFNFKDWAKSYKCSMNKGVERKQCTIQINIYSTEWRQTAIPTATSIWLSMAILRMLCSPIVQAWNSARTQLHTAAVIDRRWVFWQKLYFLWDLNVHRTMFLAADHVPQLMRTPREKCRPARISRKQTACASKIKQNHGIAEVSSSISRNLPINLQFGN